MKPSSLSRDARKLPFDHAFPKFESARSSSAGSSKGGRKKSDNEWASFWSFCGYDLLDLSIGEAGFLSSPNYPAKYGPNRRCLWNLQVCFAYLEARNVDILNQEEQSRLKSAYIWSCGSCGP